MRRNSTYRKCDETNDDTVAGRMVDLWVDVQIWRTIGSAINLVIEAALLGITD